MDRITTAAFLVIFLMAARPVWGQQLSGRAAFSSTNFIWNPAMTASDQHLDGGAYYRQQWAGFENAPVTASAFFQVPVAEFNMSAGGFLSQAEAGPFKRNYYALAYSYQITPGLFRDDLLAFGLLAGWERFSFNEKNIIATDPDDALALNTWQTRPGVSFGCGLFYATNKEMGSLSENTFYVGIGSNQLWPKALVSTDDGAPVFHRSIHANATAGVRIAQDYFYLEPSIWADFGADNLINITASLIFELDQVFWSGLAYSSDGTVGLQLGYIFTGGFLKDGSLKVGGQGSYNLGALSAFKGWGYECLVTYRFWM